MSADTHLLAFLTAGFALSWAGVLVENAILYFLLRTLCTAFAGALFGVIVFRLAGGWVGCQ